MAQTTPERASKLWGWMQPDAGDIRRAERAEALDRLIHKGFEMLSGVTSAGEGFYSTDDGRLWVLERGTPAHGYDAAIHAFAPNRGLEAVWFSRPDDGRPKTVDALARLRERRERSAETQLAEREAERGRLRKTARPVTIGDLDRACRMTLAEAHQRVSNAGGTVGVEGGRLIVSLPPSALGGAASALPAARVLYGAAAAVVERLGRKEPLPDATVTPCGALIE